MRLSTAILETIEQNPDLFLCISLVLSGGRWSHSISIVEARPGGYKIEPYRVEQEVVAKGAYNAALSLIYSGKVRSVGLYDGWRELYKDVAN